MRRSRHLAVAALALPALLACGGTDQEREGATATSRRAAEGAPFTVTVCSGDNLRNNCTTLGNTTNLDLSDLNRIIYDGPGRVPLAKNIRSLQLTGNAWVALFAEPNFKGDAVYVGWNNGWVGSLSNVQRADGTFANFASKAQSMAIFVRGDQNPLSKKVNIVARGAQPSSAGGEGAPDENKMFVSADGLSSDKWGWPLIANRDVAGDVTGAWGSWETFEMYTVGYGVPKSMEGTFFALRASWGAGFTDPNQNTITRKFVAAEWQAGGHAPLYASRDEIGPWEVFRLEPIKKGGNWQKAHFYPITSNDRRYWAVVGANAKAPLSAYVYAPQPSLQAAHEFWIQDVTTTQQGQPLLIHPYTADCSAHFFKDAEGKDRMYLYPSHDPDLWMGTFRMTDYHVFSMKTPTSQVIDHGAVVTVGQGAAAWAKEKMWAPDATYKDGRYYLFFPAKGSDDRNHIGVAESTKPEGPFKKVDALAGYIPNSFSIDPGVLDDGGTYYLYTGGLRGGELECYVPTESLVKNDEGKDEWVVSSWKYQGDKCNPNGDGHMLERPGPVVAKLNSDMVSIEGVPQPIGIYTAAGEPIAQQDAYYDRTYFEAPFVVKVNDTYYLTYSTGPSGNIWVAQAKNPRGDLMPDHRRGFKAMENGNLLPGPRCGWTTHHSVVHTTTGEWGDKWYLFYHDSQLAPNAPPLGECGPSPADGLMDKRTIMFKEIQFPPAK